VVYVKGEDATAAFEAIGHSEAAQLMKCDFLIGKLVGTLLLQM